MNKRDLSAEENTTLLEVEKAFHNVDLTKEAYIACEFVDNQNKKCIIKSIAISSHNLSELIPLIIQANHFVILSDLDIIYWKDLPGKCSYRNDDCLGLKTTISNIYQFFLKATQIFVKSPQDRGQFAEILDLISQSLENNGENIAIIFKYRDKQEFLVKINDKESKEWALDEFGAVMSTLCKINKGFKRNPYLQMSSQVPDSLFHDLDTFTMHINSISVGQDKDNQRAVEINDDLLRKSIIFEKQINGSIQNLPRVSKVGRQL